MCRHFCPLLKAIGLDIAMWQCNNERYWTRRIDGDDVFSSGFLLHKLSRVLGNRYIYNLLSVYLEMTDPRQTSEEERQAPFRAMEKADEDQIVAAMRGKYLEGMVYSFKQAGRTVTGISYMGVKEITYQLAVETGREIDTELVERAEDEDNYYVTVRAVHKGVGSRLGASVQAKKFSSGAKDPFAFTKALSKAQRNALRAVIPELSIQQFIEEAQKGGGGKVKDVTSTQESSRWKNDRGFWTCNDTGITELETPIPDKVSDALEDAGVDPSALRMGTYGGEPVLFLPNVNTKINPYKKVLKEITDPSKFEYCAGNLSSHWFPVDKK